MAQLETTRRGFLCLQLGIVGMFKAASEQPGESPMKLRPLYKGYAIAPRSGVQEATLTKLQRSHYWLVFGENRRMVAKHSIDGGRSWSKTQPVLDQGGAGIPTNHDTIMASLLHLKSGALGLVYTGPSSRPGRDGTLLYRSSTDGGLTWSAPVVIDPIFCVCRASSARVLSNGRIVVPVFKWYSPAAGPESEDEQYSICISWVFYSDDEGRTWKRSLSELFVSIDSGRGGCYSFEEPVLEELSDGRLLMLGRTELGRFYQSISKDNGSIWSVPRPVQLAASYTPPLLKRVPDTSDLLLIWNQASGEEILAGLSRHRLSTAISKDGGRTWTHFRNLESLDDRDHLNAPPSTPRVYRMVNFEYRQPVDLVRYQHAPGCVRVCYPTVVFNDDEVAVAYDYGYGGPGALEKGSSTKIKIVPRAWLYGE